MAGKVKLKVVPSMFSDFIEKLNTVASIDDTVKLKIDNENILMYAMLGGGNVILAFKNFLLPTKECNKERGMPQHPHKHAHVCGHTHIFVD